MITNFPVHVAGEFLGEWLVLNSLVKLDSAFCSTTLRPQFLEVLASPFCILQSRVYSFGSSPNCWYLNRRLKLSNIEMYYSEEKTYIVKYLERFKHNVHVLRCFYGQHLQTLAPYLHNLTSLTISDFSVASAVYNMLKNNSFLQEVRLERMWALDGQLFELVDLKHVSLLSLTSCFWKGDWASRFAKSCPHLTQVDLKRSHSLSSTELINFAEHCPLVKSLGLQHLQFGDGTLAQLALLCPHIINLDIRENVNVTDRGIQKLASNLTSLRSLNIAYCYRLTDLSLVHLTESRANTLEVLRLNGFLSARANVFCSFLQKCTKLHTISTGLQLSTHVEVIPHMHHLKSLIIWSVVTDDMLLEIARHCTQLEVLNITHTLSEVHNVAAPGAPLSASRHTDFMYAVTARSSVGEVPFTERVKGSEGELDPLEAPRYGCGKHLGCDERVAVHMSAIEGGSFNWFVQHSAAENLACRKRGGSV